MHPNSDSCEKKPAEVVLMISGEESPLGPTASHQNPSKDSTVESLGASAKDPKDAVFRPKPPSPEMKYSSSPRKPPKPPKPETLLRRRSIASSAFAKPKSRFEEQTLLPATNLADENLPNNHDRPSGSPFHGSPNVRAVGTPKTPSNALEEDEEEEIYKTEHFPETIEKQRSFKVRILIEWAILVLTMGCLIASLLVHKLQGFVIWGLEIWKWCVVVMVICCGRLVTQWLMTILVFMIERNFLLKKKVLYFVYGLKNSVRICIWLALVLLSWSLLFDHRVERSEKTRMLSYVTRALISLLVGSVIWLVKIILVKILAASFHMNKFFDRISESFFYQSVLQTLSGPPVMELAEKVGSTKSLAQLSFRSVIKEKGKGGEEQGVIDVAKLHKMRQEKVSALTMKNLMNVIGSSGLTTISNTIESFEDDGVEHKDQEITSELEAKAAASQIFKNVAKPGYKYIEAEDLMRFLSKEEVLSVLPLFEGAAETGKIKKSALRNWVVKAYLDRKSLAHSLNDSKTAVKQLHRLATAIVVVVIIVMTLLLMGFATTQILVVVSSQFLVVGFMFSNTCKTAFEAIIFVFVMHPFDVGDRCVVDGVQMIVEEMNILTTVFLRFDYEKIYYPNSVLATKPISNFYRSPDMCDTILFSVAVSTSMESIGAFKLRIFKYIESKPNHWHPNHSVIVKDIENVNKLNMALNVRHTINFQNIPEKNSRRSDLVLEMKKIFEELSIQYHLLPQEVHLGYKGAGVMPPPVVTDQVY